MLKELLIDNQNEYNSGIWFEEKDKLYEPIRFYHDRNNLKKAINDYYKGKNLL